MTYNGLIRIIRITWICSIQWLSTYAWKVDLLLTLSTVITIKKWLYFKISKWPWNRYMNEAKNGNHYLSRNLTALVRQQQHIKRWHWRRDKRSVDCWLERHFASLRLELKKRSRVRIIFVPLDSFLPIFDFSLYLSILAIFLRST